MSHLHAEDLWLFAAGTLGGADLLRVDSHVDECDECRQRSLALSGPAVRLGDAPPSVAHLIDQAAANASPIDTLLSELQEAKNAMRVACRISSGNQRTLGQILVAESWVYHAAGRFRAAIDSAAEARNLFAAIHEEVDLGRALLTQSDSLTAVRDFPAAMETVRDARLLFEKHHETRRATITRHQEAIILAMSDRLAEAVQLIEELLAGSGPNDPYRAYWQHHIASCLVRLGRDLDRAEDLLNQALASPEYIENPFSRVQALWTRAKIAIQRGKYEDALEQLLSVQHEAEAARFKALAMEARCDIADLLALLGRAEESAQQAWAVIDYFAQEKLTRRAKHAMSILREVSLSNRAVTCHDLRAFRAEIADEFDHPPIVDELPPS
jgi:tetratricopeptide (TPR) repeat protein